MRTSGAALNPWLRAVFAGVIGAVCWAVIILIVGLHWPVVTPGKGLEAIIATITALQCAIV